VDQFLAVCYRVVSRIGFGPNFEKHFGPNSGTNRRVGHLFQYQV